MGLEGLLSGHDLILRHGSTLKDLPSKCLKEYAPNNSWMEKKQLENQLEEKFNFIKADRIERSCSLSQAEWVSHLKKAKVTKKVGKIWETLGHHQDNEDWLLPEEALFLMENCELQLYCDQVSISIEDCYELLFNDGQYSLDEYRVFSYLSRAGLRVVRHSPSVTVTRYEQQVKLDSIVQLQRRTPPPHQEVSNDNEVTLLDEEICVISEPQNADKTKNLLNKAQQIKEDIVVIDIDDDDDVESNPPDDIKCIDSDSDSDVICISSPSYVSEEKPTRPWYPNIYKCLRIRTDIVIDLSDDEDEDSIRSSNDLLNVSKREILSRVPSVRCGGITIIKVPDKRLIPSAIVPKHSEYTLNLNIKPDNSQRNQPREQEHPFNGRPCVPPLVNGFGGFNNAIIGYNPILQRAQEMQAMAMNMIQTAATLMSNFINRPNRNPNELWDMHNNGNGSLVPFTSRLGGYMRHPRHYFPYRRPHRYPPRRPHERRNPWSVRNSYRFDNSRPNFGEVKSVPSSKSTSNSCDIVILSDDDEDELEITSTKASEKSESDDLGKRKRNDDVEPDKRLKSDKNEKNNLDSLCILEPSENVKLENDDSSISDSINSDVQQLIKNEINEEGEIKKEPNKHTNAKQEIDDENGVKREPIEVTNIKEELERNIKSEHRKDGKVEEKANEDRDVKRLFVDSNVKKESTEDVAVLREQDKTDGDKIHLEEHSSDDKTQRLPVNSNVVPTVPVNNVILTPERDQSLPMSSSCFKTVEIDDNEVISSSHKNSNDRDQSSEKQNSIVLPVILGNDSALPIGNADENQSLILSNSNNIPQAVDVCLTTNQESKTDEVSECRLISERNMEDSKNHNYTQHDNSTSDIRSKNLDNAKSSHDLVMDVDDEPNETTSWEQYKQMPMEDLYDNDSLLKLDTCHSYSDVLTSLQIFKSIRPDQKRNRFKISFDIYLPDSSFKKSLKVLPNYRVIVIQCSEELPSPLDLQGLASEYQDNIPFLFGIVFTETVAFYLYNSVSLNRIFD